MDHDRLEAWRYNDTEPDVKDLEPREKVTDKETNKEKKTDREKETERMRQIEICEIVCIVCTTSRCPL